MSIAENLARVRERVAAAAKRAGRSESQSDVALMAVCKTFPADAIREAYAAGQRLFGENRVQEFGEKAPKVADLAGLEMHLIGHLQSNKASKAAELFQAVDSVDSLKLAERLNAAAEKLGKKLPVLIEVNVGGEEAKSGVGASVDEIGVDSFGCADAGEPRISRPHDRASVYRRSGGSASVSFASCASCAMKWRNSKAIRLDVLSMGMSHDFEVAIEEGSTCVRVGTAIFGVRPKKQ